MGFPTNPDNGDTYITAVGVKYEYVSVTDKWIIISGDFNHNDLSGLNAGDDYEHISQAQKTALHDKYTDTLARAAIGNIFGSDGKLDADLDLDEHNIIFNPAQSSDGDYNGIIISTTVDENTQGFGNLLHLDTDGHYIDAHADNEATMPCNGIALETGTGTKKIMKIGYIREDDWNWTPGELLWVDMTNSGDIVNTKPTGTGKFVQCIGYAETADIIYFNPDKEYFELS